MLSADLVRIRRRSGRLFVQSLNEAEYARLMIVAEHSIRILRENLGASRQHIERFMDDVDGDPRDYKLVKGLRKILSDRCSYQPRGEIEPSVYRRALFSRAAAHRRAMDDDAMFTPCSIYSEVGAELGMDALASEEHLFADLRENHVLMNFDLIEPKALLEHFEMAQKQAVLLRALRVVLTLRCRDPGVYRVFFRRLKFRRLLYRIESQADGSYSVEIDGPFSLFKAVTKYGLQLALLLPALEEMDEWELNADVRFGNDTEPCSFRLVGSGRHNLSEVLRLPDEVEQLRSSFERLKTDWSLEVANDLLELPGVGLCVPDFVCTHALTGVCVFIEVMGYWSRDAVWRRVELVQAGLSQPIIFALSSRLRVSEEVLDADLPGQLYVYKGSMSPKAILERLEKFVSSSLQARSA